MAKTVRVKIVGDDTELKKAYKSAEKETGNFASGLSDTFNSGFATLGAGVAIGGIFEAAIDMEGVRSKINAQLNLVGEEAEIAGQLASDLYAGGWGETAADVGNALAMVAPEFDKITTETAGEIEKVTQVALDLSKAFDQDITSSMQAASAMVDNGLVPSLDDAFDILTVGLSEGGTRADDLLDTFAEYSNQFNSLGLDGQRSLGLINAALDAGARNTDVVADSIKEMWIRVTEGDKNAKSTLKNLGLNVNELSAAFIKGGSAADGAMSDILEGLESIEDPTDRAQAAMTVMGTQFEQVGLDALSAMADAETGIADLGTAAEDMSNELNDTVGTQMTIAWREFQTSAAEAGTVVLPVLSELMVFAADNADAFMILGGVILTVKAGMILYSAALGVYNGIVVASTALQAAWNLVMMASPLLIWAVVIAGVVAALVLLYNKSQTVRDIVAALITGVKDLWGMMKRSGDWIINSYTKMIQWLIDKFNSLFAKLTEIKDKIFSLGRKILGRFKDGLVFGWNLLWSWFSTLPGRILGKIKPNILWDLGKKIMQGLLDGLKAGWKKVTSFLSSVTDKIPDWKGPPEKDRKLLIGSGQLVMEGFGTGLDDEWAQIQNKLAGFTSDISGDFGVQGQELVGAGVGLGELSVGSQAGGVTEQTFNIDITVQGDVDAATLIDEIEDELRKRGLG